MKLPWEPGWDGTCYVCAYFRIEPPFVALEPTVYTGYEADMLCELHCGRMMERRCVVCGHDRWPVDITEEIHMFVCNPCFVRKRGMAEAIMFQAMAGDGEPSCN